MVGSIPGITLRGRKGETYIRQQINILRAKVELGKKKKQQNPKHEERITDGAKTGCCIKLANGVEIYQIEDGEFRKKELCAAFFFDKLPL